MNQRFLTVAIIGCLLLAQTALPAAAQMTNVRYVIEDLGALGANPTNSSFATGINSIGQVCGWSRDDAGIDFPFRWTNGTMLNLGAPGVAQDINDFGFVTGSIKTANNKNHAFLYNNSTLIDLGIGTTDFPTGGDSTLAYGINNRGEIVGYQSGAQTVPVVGFYYDGTTFRNLNSLLPAGSGWNLWYAWEINDNRQIVGGGFLEGSNFMRAFRFDLGSNSAVDVSGFSNFYTGSAVAINNLGKSVGSRWGDPVSHGFRHADASGLSPLASPFPCSTNHGANGINTRGAIVGSAYPITSGCGPQSPFVFSAILWTPSGQALNLNNLIDPSLGWVLTTATAINDRGQIVGNGRRGGLERAFRLTPIRPENNQVSDFDGDGKSDISVFRPSSGDWDVLRSSRQDWVHVHFGAAGDKIAPGDFDGDGKTDLTVYRGGQWYILQSGDGSFRAAPFGLPDDVPTPADYDADGRTDIAVFRPSNGDWYVSRSSDNSFAAQQFGQTGDKPVVGDYDADGRADYAVYRPSNGTWYFLRSTLGFTGVQFGIASDRPIQGDYDGDGRTDIAVFRPSEGIWYMLRSQSGFIATQFGISTDEPVPGDYDGDGKFDLGIYRNGLWYLRHSQSGFDVAQQFGQAGDKPVPAAYIPAGN